METPHTEILLQEIQMVTKGVRFSGLERSQSGTDESYTNSNNANQQNHTWMVAGHAQAGIHDRDIPMPWMQL
jgi:hypothetical protein